jgi:hypothetical protein
MFDFIVDYVQKNIWCTPGQDMQSIVQPARITPLGGVWNTVAVQWRRIALPQMGVRFHVYQVGGLNPELLGLLGIERRWVTMTEACNANNLIVDIYAASGVQMPRYETYYMVTNDKTLIIAVKKQPTIPVNLDTEPIFLRFYRNAYYNSAASSKIADFVSVVGQTCLNTNAILAMQNGYNAIQAQIASGAIPKGEVYAFVNGYRVSGIDLFTAKVGDVVEYIYDSSIYQVLDFSIGALPTFTSSLDSVYKFLLHYAGAGDGQINYQDDIDVFVRAPGDTQGRWTGLYYHRNRPDAMRMVTHKDYSIPTQLVATYVQQQPQWGGDMSKLMLRLHVRKSGWNRKLVFENNRIHELYKMPDAEIVRAMVGTDANMVYWQAATLEASAYTAVMRANLPDITNKLAQDCLGYNALSQVIGMTPSMTYVESGQTVADIPYGMTNGSTAYEFDANGNLIGFFQHPYGTQYPTSTSFCAMVEMIAGIGGAFLDEVYGHQTVPIAPGANYRVYTCPIDPVTLKPTYKWTDVTGTSAYMIQNSTIFFATDPAKVYTLVRGDRKHLAYEISLPMDRGVLQFNLTQSVLRNLQISNIIMEIPLGELDIWLNDNKLVEGIDYIVQFPQVVITNKQYLKNVKTDPQDIVVRFTGFCNADFSRQQFDDVGFIEWGRLSNNNKFDIRDDKVLSIQVGGRTYDRSELLFAEKDAGVTVPDARNGEPYQVRDIIVPLQGLTGDDTYSLRAKSQVIDKAVSDYLTAKLPESDPGTPNVISEQWPVYSPFLSRIMADLLSGVLAPAYLTGAYSDQDVLTTCQPYTWLLAFDQTQDATLADPNYMNVQPHPYQDVQQVSIYIYKFLSRVNAVFLHNRTNLSHFINIAQIA